MLPTIIDRFESFPTLKKPERSRTERGNTVIFLYDNAP